MAVLLRAVGIPSRVVTGFQGGVYNPVSGWHVLRASDAHAWVEAYLPAIGWTAFDPTPPSPRPQPLSPLAHLAFYLDATETFWQEWVLSYDLARQLVLASRMERTSRSLGTRWLEALAERSTSAVTRAKGLVRSRWPVLVAFVLLVALAVTLAVRTPQSWRVRRGLRRLGRGRGNPAEATLLYQRLLRVLERRGYRKPPWLTPAEFAAVLPESELARQVREFTLQLQPTTVRRRNRRRPRAGCDLGCARKGPTSESVLGAGKILAEEIVAVNGGDSEFSGGRRSAGDPW
jgi:hypothetical protein